MAKVFYSFSVLFVCGVRYGILSLSLKVSHSARASSKPMALRCGGDGMKGAFWWSGALRESAPCAHGHGSGRKGGEARMTANLSAMLRPGSHLGDLKL